MACFIYMFNTIPHYYSSKGSTLFCISEPFKTCENRFLYNYGSTRTGDHEHRTTLSDSLIIEVNTNDSVSTKCFCMLLHFLNRGFFAFAQHLFIGFTASSDEVPDAGKEVFYEVSTDNCFSRDNSFILFDRTTFNGWGCCDNYNLLSVLII